MSEVNNTQQNNADNEELLDNTVRDSIVDDSVDSKNDDDISLVNAYKNLMDDLRRLKRKQKCNTAWLVITVMALAGFAGYVLTRPEVKIPQQIDYSADISRNSAGIQEVTSRISGVEKILNQKLEVKDLRTLESRIAGFDNSFDAMQKELAKMNAKFSEVSKDDNSHSITWDYFDAKYLVTLAERKAVFDHDYETAIKLLNEADKIIAGVNDSRTREIREALSKDINTLGNIPKIDTEKTLMQINELIGNVEKMKIKGIAKQSDTENEEEITSNISDWMDNIGKSVKHFANNFVIIKKKDQSDIALTTVDNEAYLRANLENYLLLVGKSCFYGEKDLYVQYLNRAKQLIEKYYEADDPVVKNTLAEINNLSGIEVAAENVKYLESSNVINSFIRKMSDN
ncbi:MAG: uroporphyrinogen-III C-methyltransferase [Ruminobacter sp.]|nr:uroporphyrinogen-III C-methyltransferase [Ruminobacter sp.]